MNDIIERNGEIICNDNGLVQIRLERLSGCGQCGSRNSCASGNAVQVIRMRLPPSTRVGDHVTVSTPASSVVLAALLGYLLPPLSLMLGAVIAGFFYAGDGATVLGAAVGFLVGLLFARLISSGMSRNSIHPFSCHSMAESVFHQGGYS